MTCKWCGSNRHLSDRCRIMGLVQHLNDEPVTHPLPDVVVMDEEQLIDELDQRSKIRSSASKVKT